MKHRIVELPYAPNALEPYISSRTVEIHYGKHHQGYADKLNDTKFGLDSNNASLTDIIINETGSEYNLAAQVWNHDFYWESLSPDGGNEPSNNLIPVLSHHFGSLEIFKRELYEAANSVFGSGWTWLVMDNGNNLKIHNASNAQNPLTEDMTPLLVLDVWEHAYYLDYMNERSKYTQNLIDHLIDWQMVEARYNQINQDN
jgi:Fe-Mn family superoxide dismutase